MFVFTFYIARTLGSEEFGRYDFAMSFGYLIGVFYELGGNIILTKHIARGLYSSFAYSLKFRIASIIIAIILITAILNIFNLYAGNFTNILYALIGIAFSSLMNLYFAFFRGISKMGYEAIVLIIQKVIFIAVAFWLITLNQTASGVLMSFCLSMLIAWMIILLVFNRQKNNYNFSDSNAEKKIQFRDYIKDVMSLALVEVFSIVYFRVTQIILEAYQGFDAVGIYGASYKFVEVFTNIPAILMIVLFPGFARLSIENIKEFKVQFKKVLFVLCSLGAAAVLICWFFGEMFFSLLGSDYADSYIVLRYMTLALFMIYPNYLLTQAMIAMDENLKYASVIGAVLVVNILLGIILVPQYSVYGSALSVGICEFIIFVLSFIMINREFKKRLARQA